MQPDAARAFAERWISDWNSHDVERVLSHYADEIEFLSPVAAKRVGQGRVVGIPALRAYWSPALAEGSNLRFTLVDVLVGHDCLTILYDNQRGQRVAETCEFDDGDKVKRSFACYSA